MMRRGEGAEGDRKKSSAKRGPGEERTGGKRKGRQEGAEGGGGDGGNGGNGVKGARGAGRLCHPRRKDRA